MQSIERARKIRRRKNNEINGNNNGDQWQEQCEEQWETLKSADAMQPQDSRRDQRPRNKKPADERWRAAGAQKTD